MSAEIGIAFLGGLIVGWLVGARWMWRIWDRVLREFEGERFEHKGSAWYRVARMRR